MKSHVFRVDEAGNGYPERRDGRSQSGAVALYCSFCVTIGIVEAKSS